MRRDTYYNARRSGELSNSSTRDGDERLTMTVRLTRRTRLMPVATLRVYGRGVHHPAEPGLGGRRLCSATASRSPTGPSRLTSGFGPRGNSMHQGVDLAASEGTDIFAAMDGTVAAAGPASGFGQWIVVDSQTPTGKVSTVYGHMYPDGVLVRQGDIRQGRTTYRRYRQQWPIHRPAPAFRVVGGRPSKPGPGGRPVVRVEQAEAARGSVCGPTDFRGGGLPDRSAQAWSGSAGVCPVASQGGRTVSGHYRAAAGRTIGGGERFPARCDRPRVVDRRTGARPSSCPARGQHGAKMLTAAARRRTSTASRMR